MSLRGLAAVVALALEQSGVAQRTLEMAVEYAGQREQFGRPIGSFQAIKHLLADMYVRAGLAQSSVYAAAAVLQEPGDDDPEAWVREMDARGVRLFGEVLRPPADATHVRVRDGQLLVSDGPFTEAKEWIAGLDVLEVADLDEAIEVAAAHPMARNGVLVLNPLWPFDVTDDHVARAAREAADRDRRLEPAVGVAS